MDNDRRGLLTVRQTAQRLALKPSTIYALSHQRRIRCVKFGRALRFRPEDVEQFIQDNIREPEEISVDVRP